LQKAPTPKKESSRKREKQIEKQRWMAELMSLKEEIATLRQN